MKYFLLCVCFLFFSLAKSSDTIWVEDIKDARYLRYLDSAKAFELGFSVAKNISDTIKNFVGNNSLEGYFLGRYDPSYDASSQGYFYDYQENAPVTIGHVNESYKGMKDEAKFPWQYLEKQYKRLDVLKIAPAGVMQGAELPNVYIYAKPSSVYIYHEMHRFAVVDPAIKFLKKSDGKTKVAYIQKYYYSREGKNLQQIDSIEKIDPVTFKHVFE